MFEETAERSERPASKEVSPRLLRFAAPDAGGGRREGASEQPARRFKEVTTWVMI